jgi:hypothetical protein
MAQTAEYLSPAQLALRWDGAVTTGTLANWRSKGLGPAYSKFGSRVRYPVAKVIAWEEKNLRGDNDNERKTEAIAK